MSIMDDEKYGAIIFCDLCIKKPLDSNHIKVSFEIEVKITLIYTS